MEYKGKTFAIKSIYPIGNLKKRKPSETIKFKRKVSGEAIPEVDGIFEDFKVFQTLAQMEPEENDPFAKWLHREMGEFISMLVLPRFGFQIRS